MISTKDGGDKEREKCTHYCAVWCAVFCCFCCVFCEVLDSDAWATVNHQLSQRQVEAQDESLIRKFMLVLWWYHRIYCQRTDHRTVFRKIASMRSHRKPQLQAVQAAFKYAQRRNTVLAARSTPTPSQKRLKMAYGINAWCAQLCRHQGEPTTLEAGPHSDRGRRLALVAQASSDPSGRCVAPGACCTCCCNPARRQRACRRREGHGAVQSMDETRRVFQLLSLVEGVVLPQISRIRLVSESCRFLLHSPPLRLDPSLTTFKMAASLSQTLILLMALVVVQTIGEGDC